MSHARDHDHDHAAEDHHEQTASGTLRTLTYTEALHGQDSYIQAMLIGAGSAAAYVPGTAVTITYSFTNTQIYSAFDDRSGAIAFTASEQAATRQMMADISKHVNITFVESSNPADANLYFYKSNLIANGGPYGYGGGYWYDGVFRSRVVIDADQIQLPNSYLLLHEMGHALGLSHPHDGTHKLPSDLDHRDNTRLSYNLGPNDEYFTTYKALDIMALQYLYGGKGYYDGTTGWEGASSSSSDGRDYLIGNAQGNDIRGNHGSDMIEGGAGNDTLFGGYVIADPDDQSDTIYGGDGDDLLYGNGGNDRLYGDAGNDTIWGGIGAEVIHGGDGDDYLAGGGAVAHPLDQADSIDAGSGNDYVLGNGGDDYLLGGSGNDTIYGGVGIDNIWGGDGDDILYGQDGNDRLTGGAGRDIFHYSSNSDKDFILDFVRGEDVIRIESNINGLHLNSGNIMNHVGTSSGLLYVSLSSNHNHIIWLTDVSGLTAQDFQFV